MEKKVRYEHFWGEKVPYLQLTKNARNALHTTFLAISKAKYLEWILAHAARGVISLSITDILGANIAPE